MSVGLLIITHRPLAGDLLRIAGEILGGSPPGVEAFEVVNDTPCEQLVAEGLRRIDRLEQGDGVLVLTDLFGSTPANVATSLQNLRANVRVLTGVNLPMLLRTLNYAALDLETVAEKALQGGRDGVRLCEHEPQ
ncbi:PTS sugar transporter subunit IIA [Imhoffiella purpurea]|uniref:PTS system fructose subfamily IIA component n=1 Tax=Imhoffiella purpurea TaxID=1249627 RepID=W9V9W9_9GAMM|nr:PTS fructose transporter subunit IIA [Imhoffiella purpurea]EXJ16388.1 PTS system fructose subfamily IIA component [Imhoffiella purpurea]